MLMAAEELVLGNKFKFTQILENFQSITIFPSKYCDILRKCQSLDGTGGKCVPTRGVYHISMIRNVQDLPWSAKIFAQNGDIVKYGI